MNTVFSQIPIPGRAVAPRYGVSKDRVPTPATVLGLVAGTVGLPVQKFVLNAKTDEYMYFALPVGQEIEFFDPVTGFYGGWDGALDAPYTTEGPVRVTVLIRNVQHTFLVFRSDHKSLGRVEWVARSR